MEKKQKSKKIMFVATKTKFIKEYCIPILKYLKESGNEIHIASFGNEKIQYCDKQYNICFNTKRIQTYKLLRDIIIENNYDFIQCYTLWGGIITRLAARKSESKVIYIANELSQYKNSSIKNRFLYYPIEKYLSKYTDILITTTEEDYLLAKNKFKSKKNKLIEGMYIDNYELEKELKDDEKEKILKEYNLNKKDYILLTIGDFIKNNNQILQIEAIMQIISEYKNIKLLMVGQGPLEEVYTNLIMKYELGKYIQIIEDEKSITNLLKQCDILLTTSKNERIDLNVIKAMILNKPIIASRIKCYENLLDNDCLINLINSKELISKIEKNIILGKRNVYYNKEKYKLENVLQSIKKIYKQL